jgi:ubiquinone/menaquinone biosynthesis C-methylase UbiE
MKPFLQDILMVPMHSFEGLAARFKFARFLYALMAPFYHFGRRLSYFGEDVLLSDLEGRHKVLDLCCGTGVVSNLATKKAAEVVGIDLDPGMLRKALSIRAKKGAAGPLYLQADVTALPFKDGSFDSCVSLGALHCVPYLRACKEAHRALKPGGTFSVLIDFKVIPFFKPDSSAASLRSALQQSGFTEIVEQKIGRLYLCVKSRKS